MQFKRVNRALKRGHLRVVTKPRFTGQYDRAGVPVFEEVPFLQRKTKRNGSVWVFYSGL